MKEKLRPRLHVVVTALALGTACLLMAHQPARHAAAQAADTNAPAHPPAESTPHNAPKLTDESSVDDLLDALHHAGRDLRTLFAQVELQDFDLDTGDDPRRPGRIWLQRTDETVRFKAVFPGRFLGEGDDAPFRPERIEYLLEDDLLIDRNYATRTEVTRRLPPEERGRDLLRLGEGPFPLPIGQSREDVRRLFDVEEIDPDDPEQNDLEEPADEGTRRLRMLPRAGTSLARDFQRIEIDIRLETGLPAKVMTLNRAENQIRVTDLRRLEINPDLPADAFEIEQIDRGQWNVIYEEF